MPSQHSIGIDIHYNSALFVHLKRSFNRIRLVNHTIYSYNKTESFEKNLNSLGIFVEGYIRDNRLPSPKIFLSVPEKIAMRRILDFPLAVRENLKTTLTYEMERFIPIPAENLYFDFHIFTEDKSVDRLTVLLILIKKETFTPYIAFAEQLNGNICGIEPCTTALTNALAYGRGKAVSDLNPADLINADEDLKDVDLSKTGLTSPDYLSAYGLALKGVADVPIRIDLLPSEFRKAPGRAGRHLMVLLLFLLILSGLFWGGGTLYRQRQFLNRLDEQIAQISSQVGDTEGLRQQFESLKAQTDLFQHLSDRSASALHIVRELTRLIPETAWVYQLNLSGDEVQIEGYAESASELIQVLESSPLFRDVTFISTITKTRDGKERFKIGMNIGNQR